MENLTFEEFKNLGIEERNKALRIMVNILSKYCKSNDNDCSTCPFYLGENENEEGCEMYNMLFEE